MKYRVFTYPVPCDEAVVELNGFLSSHRILWVRDEIVVKGSAPYLLFVVEYLDGLGGEKTAKPPKVDYREELTEGEFSVFSALRDWRKTRNETEGVPVYTLFTNAQLADIVKKKIGTMAELGNVEGVGFHSCAGSQRPAPLHFLRPGVMNSSVHFSRLLDYGTDHLGSSKTAQLQ